MKIKVNLYKYLLLPIFMVGLILPTRALQAQAAKPAVVVSIASLDEWLADIKYLAEQGGAAGQAQLLEGIIGTFVQGLDRKRPIGATVAIGAAGPQPLVFIPVTNFGQLLGVIEQQLGQAQDAGNGVKKLPIPGQPVFVKEQNGWAFIAQSADALGTLPAKPLALLGGMEKTYNLGIRGNIRSLPPQMRQGLIATMEQGAQIGLQQQGGESDEQFQLRKAVAEMQLKRVKEFFNSLDTASIGFAIDAKAKQVYIDASFTGTSGSQLARMAPSLNNTTSKFGGFLMSDAAMTLNMSTKVLPEDITQVDKLMKLGRQKALEDLDGEDLPPAVKTKVKGILEELIGVAEATLKKGTIDGGAAVILEPKAIKFVAGGQVANGKKLEKAFRELVDLGKEDPSFPQVTFNVGKHGDVDFHSLTMPVDDAEAAQFLGDKIEVVVGTGNSSFFVAFGKDCQSLIKQVIDASAKATSTTVPAAQMNFALGPIMQFASSIEDDPIVGMLANKLKDHKGKDRIRVTVRPAPNGLTYRLEAEEGIIKLLGSLPGLLGGGGGF